jgi:acetaldehyde dehydrogenase (acetylating)
MNRVLQLLNGMAVLLGIQTTRLVELEDRVEYLENEVLKRVDMMRAETVATAQAAREATVSCNRLAEALDRTNPKEPWQ